MNSLIFVSCLLMSTCLAFDPRIINGDPAGPKQFPWQAALNVTKFGRTNWCGGALISERWVLTAGHCVEDATHISVRLGSNQLLDEDSNRVVLDTIQWILHEKYSRGLDNDIAVVLLPQSVTFNAHIQPVALAGARPAVGTTVAVSGWGLTSDSSTKPSTTLNYVNLSTISDDECVVPYHHQLPTGAFCAKHKETLVQGTCEGDSGGPLVAGLIHVGVVSFGHPDGCESGYPVAFARTDFYRAWIRDATGV